MYTISSYLYEKKKEEVEEEVIFTKKERIEKYFYNLDLLFGNIRNKYEA